MQSTELEDVKRKMLDLLDKIELTRRQNASLKNERFNISLLGNPGTGALIGFSFFSRIYQFLTIFLPPQAKPLWPDITPTS